MALIQKGKNMNHIILCIQEFFKKTFKNRKVEEVASNTTKVLFDEMGVIPERVNILVPSYYFDEPLVQWCIAERNGVFYLQKWTIAGRMKEWSVPMAMISAENVKGIENFHENGDVIAITETKHNSLDSHMLFYRDKQGRTLFYKVNSEFFDKEYLFIATTDGKAIRYHWGDDHVMIHDFGVDTTLNIFDHEEFLLDSSPIEMDEIEFKEVGLPYVD